jgi:hypothetical protein
MGAVTKRRLARRLGLVEAEVGGTDHGRRGPARHVRRAREIGGMGRARG